MNPDEVRRQLDAVRADDLPTHGGRTLAYVYDSGLAEADALGREALAAFGGTNGLDPTAFPSLLRMEQDLVGMAADLLDGPPGTVGSVTSGGTESLLLAVQTARDARPDVSRPTLVMPSSAHASFHKAAHYFGVRPVLVDVDPQTGRAVASAMADAIDADTVLVVASAPSYPHGVVDPVTEIATHAQAAGVRCHVDACIGGWLLPFLRRDDPELPAFSFLVPGVTSISVDLHKYGYTPKGVSLLLHRSAQLRRPQLFASAAWPGYTMLNTTTQSTRSGGPIAAAWAITRLIGDDGYLALARQVRDGLTSLVDAVQARPHLRVVGRPSSSLVALASDDAFDIFTVADELLARGWYVQPQLSFGPFPPTLHLSVSAATVPRLPEFLDALDAAVAAAVAAGPTTADPGLAGVLAELDPTTLDDAGFDQLLAMAGLVDGSGTPTLPTRMAPVNATLDVAPPSLREALLLGYLDRISRPVRAADRG
ncbi:Glutamate or tyrosine decarboxylase [Friedmanniella luteola]|uniref:Glutamate or tyrosine decarboxylase n=1 Tax=Friedmanniella luteola TaxID=546871 RepID=A0A1H1LCC4_9ACTN|nr:aspartate aminotransferase family protein [Friedmanniella luteola]SDR71962.1 Glutamate or tyrosine decarboxylase [Friedmanniella luteola]